MVSSSIRHSYYDTGLVKLHVAEAGPADGPLLILLHGFPEFWYGWINQIEFFAREGYKVVAPDQRGYNLSDKPKRIESYTSSKLVADIAGLIKVLERSEAIIVGHDWGGAVAWQLAIQQPQLVSKLVVLNIPHPAVMLATLKKSVSQLLKSWYIGFFQLPVLPELLLKVSGYKILSGMMLNSSRKGAFSDRELVLYKEAWSQPGSMQSMINWYRAARLETKQAQHPLRIRVPVMMIWGKKDKFLNSEMAEASMKLCDNGQLHYLDNATHWLQHEEPVKVNDLILNFIKK